MEDVVEVAREARKQAIVGDRALDQVDARKIWDVLALRGEQIVDDDNLAG